MAKWDFKIVGASFVKELVPIADDVQPRSQSFMQPSFHLEGGKIVMKESGQYVTAIYFPQIGEIDGVAPTDIEDANAKLLTLVENFNGGGGTPPNLGEVLTQGNRAPLAVNANRVFTLEDRTKNLYSLFDLSTTVSLTLNNSVAYDLGDVLKIQHYVGVDGSEASTMNLVFDSVTVFYGNDLITSFSIPYGAVAYLEKILPSTWTLSYKLAQDIGGSAQNSMTPSTTLAPTVSAVLTEYDMITGLTFSGVFGLDKKGGRSYLPYTQTGVLPLSIGASPIAGGFAVLRFTANGSAISGFSGWKLLSSDDITPTNGVVHRVIVYQYEDEIWYSVKLN